MHTIPYQHNFKLKVKHQVDRLMSVQLPRIGFLWRASGMFGLTVVGFGWLILQLNIADQAIAKRQFIESENSLITTQLELAQDLKSNGQVLNEKLGRIETDLPGLSTTELDIYSERYSDALLSSHFFEAQVLQAQMNRMADDILENQDEIAYIEIDRLQSVLSANLEQIDRVLGDRTVVPSDAVDRVVDGKVSVWDRLQLARSWVEDTSTELKRRWAEVDQAQKQIVVSKSQNTLTMYENGVPLRTIYVSVGREEAATREGNFVVLDKLGTVWSFWEIWLPYWMGVYNVGLSENGIHGLPYDDSGKVYWTEQVGSENITYGCVMPNNEDMEVLYNWAEVGTPIAIVE